MEHTAEDRYRAGLAAVLAEEPEDAFELLRSAWLWRESEQPGPIQSGAGVGVAAHLAFSGEWAEDLSTDDVLGDVRPAVLSPPVRPLYEHLDEGSTDVTPESLVEEYGDVDPEDFDPQTVDLEALEARAYARVLQGLRDAPASGERDGEHDAEDLYRAGLSAVLAGEPDDAFPMLRSAWEQRGPETPESVRAGAGVGVAAHLVLSDDPSDLSRDDVLDEIRPEEVSPSARPLYDQLVDGSTDVVPESLLQEHVGVDPNDLDPRTVDLEALEALAYARLLRALES